MQWRDAKQVIQMSSSKRQGAVGALGIVGRYYRTDLWREKTYQNQEFSSVNTGFLKHMCKSVSRGKILELWKKVLPLFHNLVNFVYAAATCRPQIYVCVKHNCRSNCWSNVKFTLTCATEPIYVPPLKLLVICTRILWVSPSIVRLIKSRRMIWTGRGEGFDGETWAKETA